MFAVEVNVEAVRIDFEEDRVFLCSRVCSVHFLTEYAKKMSPPGVLDSLPAIAKSLVWEISPGNFDVSDTFSVEDGDEDEESDAAREMSAERIFSQTGSR